MPKPSSKRGAPAPVVPLPEWKRLYRTAARFIDEEPWEYMGNVDVFAVEDPTDRQIYLCGTMGNGGEEFGLNAYRGNGGMRCFYSMLESSDAEALPRDLCYTMDMLSFSIGPRDLLEERDLATTKKLLLSYPGGQWPLFRSYRPHYVPWFLCTTEVATLCLCLEQTLEVAAPGGDVGERLREGQPGEIMVRSFEDGAWRSRFVSIAYTKRDPAPDIDFDDITRKRLESLAAGAGTLTVDLVHLGKPVAERPVPYFPLVAVGRNDTGTANAYGLWPPYKDFYRESVNAVVESWLEEGKRPAKIILGESTFGETMQRVCENAGIAVSVENELPAVAELMDDMDESL